MALAILAMLLAGIASLFAKISQDVLGPYRATFFYYFFGSICALLYWLSSTDREAWPRAALIWPLMTALLYSLSVLAFNHALKQISFNAANTTYALYFVVALILSPIFFQEKLLLKDYVASALAIAAVIVFGL